MIEVSSLGVAWLFSLRGAKVLLSESRQRQSRPLRADPADRPAAGRSPRPLALRQRLDRHARRRLRSRPHLRRRLPRARSARRRRGLAGTRDLISFFKHATAAAGNPSPGVRHAISWGVSQTGRFLRHFVYQGFNEDEQGRIVFDGVFDQVGGAGRGSFNHRFGQQSRDQLQHFNIQYPVDMFPFTDGDADRPGHGRHRRPARARAAHNTVPRMFHLLTNSEYFNRAGSLVHTDVTGTRDVPPPDTSRIYMVSSAPHIVGRVSAGAVSATRTSSARPT